MKYKDYSRLIVEAASKGSYSYDKNSSDAAIQFDIETEEDKKYRMIFTKKEDFYVAELGYQHGENKLQPIMSDFYDVDMVISTIIDIFTEVHLDGINVDHIVYKFSPMVDKAYILMIVSLFKSELKNYYSLSEHNDLKNINNLERIIIDTARGKGQMLSDTTIQKMKKV